MLWSGVLTEVTLSGLGSGDSRFRRTWGDSERKIVLPHLRSDPGSVGLTVVSNFGSIDLLGNSGLSDPHCISPGPHLGEPFRWFGLINGLLPLLLTPVGVVLTTKGSETTTVSSTVDPPGTPDRV